MFAVRARTDVTALGRVFHVLIVHLRLRGTGCKL
jgi:hypothetical protein